MKRIIFVFVLAFASFAANASLNFSSGSLVACSGSLSVFSYLTEPSLIECTGDLSFTGASVFSSTSFSISATNNLSFLDVLVFAPALYFHAGANLLVDGSSVLVAPVMNFVANSIVMGGTLITAVPEPSTPLLFAVGLGLIEIIRRRKILPLKKHLPSN